MNTGALWHMMQLQSCVRLISKWDLLPVLQTCWLWLGYAVLLFLLFCMLFLRCDLPLCHRPCHTCNNASCLYQDSVMLIDWVECSGRCNWMRKRYDSQSRRARQPGMILNLSA